MLWSFQGHSRTKRSDVIAEDLKRWIVSDGKRPGDRLPQEKELMEFFSCSRGTIREALKSLEVQGLVEIVSGPYGGARLVEVKEEVALRLLSNYFYFRNLKSRDIYKLRKDIEPLLAREVAGHLTESDFQALEKTVEACRNSVGGRVDHASDVFASLEFHQILANRAPNQLLRFYCLFLNHLLFNLVAWKHVIVGKRKTFSTHLLNAHQNLLNALRRGDGNAAGRIMKEHMRHTADFVSEVETIFDRGMDIRGAEWRQISRIDRSSSPASSSPPKPDPSPVRGTRSGGKERDKGSSKGPSRKKRGGRD